MVEIIDYNIACEIKELGDKDVSNTTTLDSTVTMQYEEQLAHNM